MTEFRFNIGDLVYTRNGISDAMLAARLGCFALPFAFVVTEQLAQRCPGGVQLHYTCSRDGTLMRAMEVELAALAEFDSEAWLSALIPAEARLNKSRAGAKEPA